MGVSELRARTAANSYTLRTSTEQLEALRYPAVQREKRPPYLARPKLVETMKDRWNAELEKAWRWCVSVDGTKARESVEEAWGNLRRNLQK